MKNFILQEKGSQGFFQQHVTGGNLSFRKMRQLIQTFRGCDFFSKRQEISTFSDFMCPVCWIINGVCQKDLFIFTFLNYLNSGIALFCFAYIRFKLYLIFKHFSTRWLGRAGETDLHFSTSLWDRMQRS